MLSLLLSEKNCMAMSIDRCVLGLHRSLEKVKQINEFSGFWREVLEGRMSLQLVQCLEHLKDERSWLIISCGTNLLRVVQRANARNLEDRIKMALKLC